MMMRLLGLLLILIALPAAAYAPARAQGVTVVPRSQGRCLTGEVSMGGVCVAAIVNPILVQPPLAPGFYVAPASAGGSDSNTGTLASPFATVARAQTAMQGGAVKLTYIRAGNYALSAVSTNCNSDGTNHSCGILLNSSDNGETLSYYPPDGVNSACFTGGSTNLHNNTYPNGLFSIVNGKNVSNITINGLCFHDFNWQAIWFGGFVSGITLVNNLVYNGYFVQVVGTGPQSAGGIGCYGCGSSTWSHNVIHDINSNGMHNSQTNGDMSNWTADSNVIYRTCLEMSDCGALYTFAGSNPTPTATVWTNNYIRDGNVWASTHDVNLGSGMYVDDCSGNVTATGNIVTGLGGQNHIQASHGGSNNHFTGNLIDLSTGGFYTSIWQSTASCVSTMTGNTFSQNIVISGGGGAGYRAYGTPLNPPTITGNTYHQYAGAAITTSGPDYTDANPQNVDPQLSCWLYTIAGGSPVLSAPTSFTPFTGGWGPPGYVIPHTGTAPSSPHSC